MTLTGKKNYVEIQNKPVIVFLSGGAWIIGYKCWGALMGKMFAEHGVIFVTPDYRNFPQVHTNMLCCLSYRPLVFLYIYMFMTL